MRISIEPDQPGYTADRDVMVNAKIFLDGIQQSGALTADEQRGFVRRYKTDGLGNMICGADGHPLIERVNGSVRIAGVSR